MKGQTWPFTSLPGQTFLGAVAPVSPPSHGSYKVLQARGPSAARLKPGLAGAAEACTVMLAASACGKRHIAKSRCKRSPMAQGLQEGQTRDPIFCRSVENPSGFLRGEEDKETSPQGFPNPDGLGLIAAQAIGAVALRVIVPQMENINETASKITQPTRLKSSTVVVPVKSPALVAATTNTEPLYQEFVDQARLVVKRGGPDIQRAFGSELLRAVVPWPVSGLVRSIFHFLEKHWFEGRRLLANFAISIFGPLIGYWLVGESRVLDAEEEATMLLRWQERRAQETKCAPADVPLQRGPVLFIKKCRFMEATAGCKGLCLNLCKAATEEYLTNELGLPVFMDPNLEDYSCRMMFLQQPVSPGEDPVFQRPCTSKTCDGRFAMPGGCGGGNAATCE